MSTELRVEVDPARLSAAASSVLQAIDARDPGRGGGLVRLGEARFFPSDQSLAVRRTGAAKTRGAIVGYATVLGVASGVAAVASVAGVGVAGAGVFGLVAGLATWVWTGAQGRYSGRVPVRSAARVSRNTGLVLTDDTLVIRRARTCTEVPRGAVDGLDEREMDFGGGTATVAVLRFGGTYEATLAGRVGAGAGDEYEPTVAAVRKWLEG